MSKKEFVPENILWCMDIDQTLAGGVVRAHLLFYNDELNLGMSPEEIDEAGKIYPHTFKVPQIKKYKEENKTEFQAARNKILVSETVNKEFALIAGADSALFFLLATYSKLLTYYTVRPSEIKDLTIEWLDEKHLPHPENVVMCLDPKDKIKKILIDAKYTNTKPILFDDGLEKLVVACEQLASDFELMEKQGQVIRDLVANKVLINDADFMKQQTEILARFYDIEPDKNITTYEQLIHDIEPEKIIMTCEQLIGDFEFMAEYKEIIQHLVIVGYGFNNVNEFIERGDKIGISIMHVENWEVLSYLWQEK